MDSRIQNIINEVNDEVLSLFGSQLDRVILYGSYARKEQTEQSDLDIMLLLKCDDREVKAFRKQVAAIASKIGMEHDIMLSIIMRGAEHYNQNMDAIPFCRNVDREGIAVYG